MCDFAAINSRTTRLADVVSNDVKAGLGELHRQWQADVPQADDADNGTPVAYLREQLIFHWAVRAGGLTTL